MTKIRGGRQFIDDLKAVRESVRGVGHDNVDHATIIKLTQDNGKVLLRMAAELDRLIKLLDPMLDRADERTPRKLDELEGRMLRVELWIARFEKQHAPQEEERPATIYEVRKHERG